MSIITAVILAAGKGTRMKSALPKVLHQANGKAMISFVIDAVLKSGVQKTVLVVGHGAKEIQDTLGEGYDYALQVPQLGTGHALKCAIPVIDKNCQSILVLCGDTPLITADTLQKLVHKFTQSGSAATILSAMMDDPTGYGRIIRDERGQVIKIVEEKDATDQQKKIQEVNTAIYCLDYPVLLSVIDDLKNDNKQQEYYLTDIIEILAHKGYLINSMLLDDSDEVMGVNDRLQLAYASQILRQRKNHNLLSAGVGIIDSNNTYIEEDVKVGPDTIIEPYTFLRGHTVIGKNCLIGPNCDISQSSIGDNCQIKQAVMIGCQTGNNCQIGPFSYLRPGTVLDDNVKVGGFVETKQTQVGKNSKIPHLSYIGDSRIGSGVNIGCGTITCNYDGFNKYLTIIDDNAFIGSNTNLIAPVSIGKGAVVAAGSSISKDVPEDALAIERSEQKNIDKWAVRKRKLILQKKEDS
ncbi:MAG: bifunctional UDP-N-acetylglucosamine diphosphorylase/glucosamine-1-phosphate N-acetyltransferase GlmU [Bacillota bacterium]|jgi:bifunctional UDP-N-acetylglucosamine pyrophosphorylase/glucosamine-1-phosphate N-acetyltransferase